MKTAKELVDQINAAEINAPHNVDEAIDMAGVSKVATIDLDEHRWYTTGTVIYRVGSEFFGVNGPVSLKSEDMSYSDIGMTCEAFEMEEVPSVTYRAKQA